MRKLNFTSRNRSAAALVEMAIVMPLLVLLTMGLIEYGWVFLRVSQVSQAARQGVRVAVRPDATEDDVINSVASMMRDAGMQDSGYTLTHSDIAVATAQPVWVQVTVGYSKLSLTGTKLLPLPDQLTGRGTMAKEGPPR